LYPFSGTEQVISQALFYRSVLVAILTSGFVSAFLALLVWSTQSSVRVEGIIRAGGTFVNPDHFACFMSLTFPMALACAMFGSELISSQWSLGFRIFSGITCFASIAALLLSGSRSGWVGVAVGVVCMLVLIRIYGRCTTRTSLVKRSHFVAAVAICIVLIAFIGTQGQESVGQRLHQSTTDTSFAERVIVWRDSLPMLRDFPLLGVGLGCWSEFFPHYESPPWPADSFWGEAHNDYLQLISELGLIGFAIVCWLLLRLLEPVISAARNSDKRFTPLITAIIASFVAVAIEECVDFGLRVPANALALAVLLGMGLRTIMQVTPQLFWPRWQLSSRLAAGGACVIAIISGIAAVMRPLDADTLYDPRTPDQAKAFVLAHPADLDAHMSLLKQPDQSMTRERFRAEVETALWLDPTNPYARDLYVLVLMDRNRRGDAISEIRRSLLYSPALSTHLFLFSDNLHLASLPADERDAIANGLAAAVARGYQDSAQNLGDFFSATGQPSSAAATFERAADAEADAPQKSVFLVEAGDSAIAAKDVHRAQIDFERATAASPHLVTPYRQLIDLMFLEKDADAAEKIAEGASRNDIDPATFYLQLARGQRDLRDFGVARTNAIKALDNDPSDPEAVRVLGTIYLAENRFRQAVPIFQRLCELTPNAADAFFYLGVAEQRDYQWFAADRDLRRAIALDLKNADYRAQYHEFEAELARNRVERREP